MIVSGDGVHVDGAMFCSSLLSLNRKQSRVKRCSTRPAEVVVADDMI